MIAYVAHAMSELVLKKPSLQYSGSLSLCLCFRTMQTRMIEHRSGFGMISKEDPGGRTELGLLVLLRTEQ